MVPTKEICRSSQSMFLTHYQQKPFQHVQRISLTCRKQKFFQSKILQEGLCVTISSCHLSFMSDFCPLLNVYFSGVQMSRWLHLSNSFWGTPIRCDLFRKRIDQKNVLLQQQISELYYLFQWSVKYIFAPNSLIFRKRRGEE